MVEPSVKLFLSCVSTEFGDYREVLRRNLTNPYVEVKIQEDFKNSAGATLEMLAQYIAACDVVIHFVGDMSGLLPAPSSVDDLLNNRPRLRDGLASKDMGREALVNNIYPMGGVARDCIGKEAIDCHPRIQRLRVVLNLCRLICPARRRQSISGGYITEN